MIGLDTSFLVAHAIAEHPQHQEAHQWLDSQDDVVNALWLKWLAEFYLGRKRLLVTLIAATWQVAGVREVWTLNPRDFKVFEVFQIHCIGTGTSSG